MMTPREYTAHLSATRHGPHDDDTTTAVAALVAEAIRWLAYATRPGSGGVSTPTTVYDLVNELDTAIYRIPQVLSYLADGLNAEVSIISDGPATVDDVRTALGEAMRSAYHLTRLLANVANLSAALRPAESPAEVA